MKKRIIIEFETEEENDKIESYIKKWVIDNVWKWEEATIKIEDINA
jgi:hypothetical protein